MTPRGGRRTTVRRLAAYLAPYKRQVAVQMVASLTATLLGLVPPAISRWIIDRALVPGGGVYLDVHGRLRLLAAGVAGLFAVRVLSSGTEWAHGWTVAWLGSHVTSDIRGELYRRLEMLSLAFYDRQDVGALTARITTDASTLQDFLIRGLPYLVTNSLTLFGILIIMASISWQLTLCVILPLPLLSIGAVVFWRRMNALFHQWGEANARFSAQLNESLSGVRDVKAFGQETREIARFDALNVRVLDRTTETARHRVALIAAVGIATGTGISVVWLLGGNSVLTGRLTVGSLVAFYSYVLLFNSPLQWFGQFSDWMTRALSGAERMFEILDTIGEAQDDDGDGHVARLTGRIQFHTVTFGYDKSTPVLRGLSADIEPGQIVGIVGRSGVGKTTMMSLLCRFYDVDDGSIAVDGVDVRRLPLSGLRRQIGVVSQEPILFSGTIAENISYGKPGATVDEIVSAAQLANAHEFIVARKNGYGTEVGERGKNLSVGERQRIAIARAILRDPPILILDEATSSVDPLSEALIHEAIQRLATGRTSFVIAHRLSTLKSADRLLVLDHGTVCESGTFDELMNTAGAFRDLVAPQQHTVEPMAEV